MKVRITKVPSKKHGGTNGSATQMHSGPQTPPTDAMADPRTGKFHGGNTPEIKINRTLKPTSRDNATLEAELGETVVTNLQGDGIPEFYKIGGKPHSRGGTPLNLPESSFIFSKDNKLKIKEPDVLNMFGKTGKAAKKGYTPADISKEYDINTYREILANPFSDKLQRETAELMIKNYNLKLGSLALVQESMKGFDAGIPELAQAYMESVGIAPEDLLLSEPPAEEQMQQFRGGGSYNAVQTGEGLLNEDNFVKTKMKRNGRLKQKEISEKKFNRIQNRYDRRGGYDGEGNDTTMFRKGNKSVSDMNAGIPSQDYERPPWISTQKRTRSIEPYTNPFTEASEDVSYMDEIGGWVRNQDDNDYSNYGSLYANQYNGDFKEGGSTKRRVRVIKSLPTAQYGIPRFKKGGSGGSDKQAPTISNRPTAKQNIPKDAWQWDENAEGYDPSKVKVGHYVLKDGRYRKVTGYEKRKYEGDQKEEKLGKYSDDYFMMVEKFESDDKLIDAMYDKYIKVLDNTKPGKHLTQKQIDTAKALSKEEVWANFKYKQASNFAVQNDLGDLSVADKKDLWDTNPKYAQEAANKVGYPALGTSDIAAFQAAYIGMNELSNDPEYSDMLQDFGLFQHGLDDESVGGTGGSGTISQVDGFDGNTTSGEVMMRRDSEMLTEDVADITEEPTNHLGQLNEPNAPAFWTEDNMNVARDFGNLMSVKKYRPWQSTPAFELADPNFVDFRGAANRMAAQTAGLAKGASNYGAGSYGTLANNMQGTMANGILQLQEQEMAKNVDTANRFELTNTAAINAYNQQKANQDTKLWDKNAIMNQQFDNSKMALRNNLANSMRDRWTNRGKTQHLNLMTDEYAVDPVTGFKHKKPGYIPIEPATQNTAMSDRARAIKDQNAGMTDADAMKWALADAGITGKKATDPYGNYPGAGEST